jgi:hypothetical protein
MGPLSHFNLFWAIQDPSRPGADRAADALAPFKLLGFVLYDPREDPDLHEELRSNWIDLDQLTGPQLMVIAPVDPPTAWQADPQVRNRPLMRVAPMLARDRSRPSDALSRQRHYGTLVSRDPSRTAVAMRSLLGIDPGMGSCIVLTRNVNSRVAWVLSTSVRTVVADIERLGIRAGRLAATTIEDPELERLLSQVAKLGNSLIERLELEEPLSVTLTDVCASAAAVSTDEINAKRATVQLRTSLARRMATTVAAPPDRLDASLARAAASLLLAGDLRDGQGPGGNSPFPHSEAAIPEISSRAAQLMQYGDWLFDLMQTESMPPGIPPDFRFPIAAWSQALEYEMAELLGHSVRHGLGVSLPKYFWQHQPGLKGVKIVPPDLNREVSFNTAARGSLDPDTARWQPPTMGDLRLGWEEWRRRTGHAADPDLIEALTRANRLRNPAAHAGDAMPESAAIEARRYVREALARLLALGVPRWSRQVIG